MFIVLKRCYVYLDDQRYNFWCHRFFTHARCTLQWLKCIKFVWM